MSLLFWTAISFHILGLVFCSHRGAGEDSVKGREEAKRGRQKPSFIQNRLSWSFLGRGALAVAPALLTFLFYFSLSNIHIALTVDQALCNCSTNLHLILITTQWKRSPFHRWRDQGSRVKWCAQAHTDIKWWVRTQTPAVRRQRPLPCLVLIWPCGYRSLIFKAGVAEPRSGDLTYWHMIHVSFLQGCALFTCTAASCYSKIGWMETIRKLFIETNNFNYGLLPLN